MMNDLIIYGNSNSGYRIKSKTYQGKKYLVVPVVMMVEGVHSGSAGPLFHSADELGKFPGSWDGIPVTIGHPSIDGVNVSANSPEVLESVAVGQVFGTYMEDKKLKAEVWINEEKIVQTSPVALGYIRQGRPLEVSIGAFTEEDATPGVYNNEPYIAIARNHRPDHLALLPGETGACSWIDGCGIRTNQEVNNNNKTHNENEKMNDDEIKALKDKAMERLVDNSLVDNAIGLQETVDKARRLVDSLDSPTAYHMMEEIFDNTIIYRKRERSIDAQGNTITRTPEEKLYQQHYNMSANGIEFVGDPIQVSRNVSYTPVVSTNQSRRTKFNVKKEEKMEKQLSSCFLGKVEKLIANKLTRFEEKDREFLLTQEESTLDLLFPREVAPEPLQVNAELIQVVKNTLKTPEDVVAFVPDFMKESVKAGLKLHEERKTAIVEAIVANAGEGGFSKEELQSMEMGQLEKIAKSTKAPVDYSGQGPAKTVQANKGEESEKMLPLGVEDK
jgi:hypothetical protein